MSLRLPFLLFMANARMNLASYLKESIKWGITLTALGVVTYNAFHGTTLRNEPIPISFDVNELQVFYLECIKRTAPNTISELKDCSDLAESTELRRAKIRDELLSKTPGAQK